MVGLFNLSTLTARKNLNKIEDDTAVTVERLSTGKINNGPSGRKVADFITAVALKNDENSYRAILDSLPRATSILQTADGAGQVIGSMVSRLKDLAYRSSSSGSDIERDALQLEFAKLTEEIDRIATTSNFNGTKLLDGTLDTATNLNSDRRLNEITSSLNVGNTALDGAQVVISRGVASSANYLDSANIAGFILDFNNGIAAGDIVITDSDASSFDASITLNSLVFNATDVNLAGSTALNFYLNADNATGASITFNLRQNEFFNSALGGSNFASRIANDLTNVIIDDKNGFVINDAGLGDEYFDGISFRVGVNNGKNGDINLVGEIKTIAVSGTWNSTSSQDVSLLINGKAYTTTDANLANATALTFTNAETGTNITLTRNSDVLGSITSQAQLDDLLKKLREDLDDVKIYQTRQVGSGPLDQFKSGIFDGTQLDGIDGFDFQLTSSAYGLINENDQEDLPVTPLFEGFRVGAETPATDGYISVIINGETYRTPDGYFDGKATDLKKNIRSITLVNERDPFEQLTINLSRATSSGINLDSEASARGLEDTLNKVFNTTRESKLSFQVGLDVNDKIALNIGGITTKDIFKNEDGQYRVLDISTSEGANEAISVLTLATQKVSLALAEITSAFARFDNVKESVRTAIKNLAEARDPIENADIAEESSKYAEFQVLRDVATAVLTTENQKNRGLVRLING